MKKKYVVLLIAAALLFGVADWVGIGPYSSGSAVADLKEELEALHGAPYAGRAVETGTENMEFYVEPDTFFFTNYNLRRFFGWGYRYTCHVTYTTHSNGKVDNVRTITYTGIDPMGSGKEEVRAYLDMEHIKGQSGQS